MQLITTISTEAATELGRRALIIALELTLPILAVGLVVGLFVSVIQAVTQIQEQTLSFIPKILAMAGTLFLLLPWLLGVTTTYMDEAFRQLEFWGGVVNEATYSK